MGDVEIVKVNNRGGVVFPAELREKLNIKTGDSLVVDGKGDVIVLKKVSGEAIGDVEKILKRVCRKSFWRR